MTVEDLLSLPTLSKLEFINIGVAHADTRGIVNYQYLGKEAVIEDWNIAKVCNFWLSKNEKIITILIQQG